MPPQAGAAPSGSCPVVIRMDSFRLSGQRMSPPVVMAQVGDETRQLAPGDNPFHLPPGTWPVHVWCQYVGKVGEAEATADTRAGQPVVLHYTAPRTIYSRGVLADGPVPRPGNGVRVGLLVAIAAVLALVWIVLLTTR